MHFLYSGNLVCPFHDNGVLLWQLLRFCNDYSLPLPLQIWAHTELLKNLSDPMCSAIIPALLVQNTTTHLTPQERHFVAKQFFCREVAWHAVSAETRKRALQVALDELEVCVSGTGQNAAGYAELDATKPFMTM